MPMLVQIPVWQDNYTYLISNGSRAFAVDPPEAAPILEALRAAGGLSLEAVLNTHHHPDHVGGNEALVEATGCEVVGAAPDRARLPGLTRGVEIGDLVEVGGLALRVLDVRAHTREHIAFACDSLVEQVVRHGHGGAAAEIPRLANRPALFVGDSLFPGGCGRLFEGTPADLYRAMRVLAAESPEALVCCAHEYTATNLKFGARVLPEHSALHRRLHELDEERAGTASSVPDTLGRELETNPFLLALDDAHRPALAEAVGAVASDPVDVLGRLRAAKDSFGSHGRADPAQS